MKVDVAIIGSGMGGSVTGLILAKLGYSVLLIERGEHPRFAIGESSTPVMSKKIRYLARKYDIKEFEELSSYDRIMASDRPLTCGPKELFHYFVHDPMQTAARVDGRYREIIVQTPEVDTQFLRAELDERLVEYARNYGVIYYDKTMVEDIDFDDNGARLQIETEDGRHLEVNADFVVDATGHKSLISQKYDLRVPDEELDTPLKSRSIFTHFRNVGALEDAVEPDPDFRDRLRVPRSRATQHHCFDGGWYWFIPFDNGVTSVGLNLDIDRFPLNDKSGEEEFWEITRQFPIVEKMLAGRETLIPYIKTGRLQFRVREAVGDRWAMLPGAAFGGDGWFSTGLGLTLIAIDRLVDALHNKAFRDHEFRRENLLHYEESIFQEWRYITRMIDGMYKSFKHYDVFKSYCFFCFMGAESYVHNGGIDWEKNKQLLLLNVGDEKFVECFDRIYNDVYAYHQRDAVTDDDSEKLSRYLREDMRDFNYRDYGNPVHDGIHYRIPKNSPYHDVG